MKMLSSKTAKLDTASCHSIKNHIITSADQSPSVTSVHHRQEQQQNGFFSKRTPIRYQRYLIFFISPLIKVSPALVKAFNEASTTATTRALKINIIDGTYLSPSHLSNDRIPRTKWNNQSYFNSRRRLLPTSRMVWRQ
jgi:hypothetical protein